MRDLFFKFLEQPDRENYLAIANALAESDHYEPYSNEFEATNSLMEGEQYEAAQKQLMGAMPNLWLSPEAHMLLGFIGHKLGEEQQSDMEMFVANACLVGITSTGDGSRKNPFVVMRTSDEYDIVRHFDKEFAGQRLIQDGDRHFDVIECKDGSEIWFDITVPYNKLGQSFGR